MNAVFQISASELDGSILKKIRALTIGRKFKVVIQLEELTDSATQINVESGKITESALAYSIRALKKVAANHAATEQILAKYGRFNFDFTGYKFNRDEANER